MGRPIASVIAVVAVGLTLSGRARADDEPTPMTPEAPGAAARAWVDLGPPPMPRSKPSDHAGSGSSSAFLVSGSLLFVLGAVQVPVGIALVNAHDSGANVAGVVNMGAGVTAVVVGLPLLVVGLVARGSRPVGPGEEELALVPSPGGGALRWSF